MIKHLRKLFLLEGKTDQEKLLDFIRDDKNLEKAALGSMQKRLDLIEKAEHLHKQAT